MTKLTFHPLGNADCTRLDLRDGQKLLFDYANMRDPKNQFDRRVDLPKVLRADLAAAKRDNYDVVAFTHLDRDHICGASEFFHFEHAAMYQGSDRIKIQELWVPAAAILEEGTTNESRVIRQEARYRLLEGKGIRVFSRPEKLQEWLSDHGIRLEDRAHLVTDAGQLVPGFDKVSDGVEFFVHSPFASRLDNGEAIDRNIDALVLQATFVEGSTETKVLLMSDVEHTAIAEIVGITRYHGNEARLEWDVVKLPHHCSYLSLAPEKGKDKTQPEPCVGWLYEKQAHDHGIIVSTSDPIPAIDTAQPPHRQAAAYYREQAQIIGGEFKVTMAHPTPGVAQPQPLVIRIDALGATVEKPSSGGAQAAVGGEAPRAG